MRPYFSVKALCSVSYTSPVPQVHGETCPNTPNHAQGHMKSNPSN